jgi:hypothetical protein
MRRVELRPRKGRGKVWAIRHISGGSCGKLHPPRVTRRPILAVVSMPMQKLTARDLQATSDMLTGLYATVELDELLERLVPLLGSVIPSAEGLCLHLDLADRRLLQGVGFPQALPRAARLERALHQHPLLAAFLGAARTDAHRLGWGEPGGGTGSRVGQRPPEPTWLGRAWRDAPDRSRVAQSWMTRVASTMARGMTSTPSARAVWRFSTRSNFWGVAMGRSPGGVPCRIWWTYVAPR